MKLVHSSGEVLCEGSSQTIVDFVTHKVKQKLFETAISPTHNKENRCPCCTRLVAVNKSNITLSIGKKLMELYVISLTKPEGSYTHVDEFIHKGGGAGMFAGLRHRELIESKPNKDIKKRGSGHWRLTKRGVAFIRNEIRIPKYLVTYDGKFLELSGELVLFSECLGEKFDYDEWRNRPPFVGDSK